MDITDHRQSTQPLPPIFIHKDLIAEILSRLSLKNVAQLKCVSKFWNTIISDPEFIYQHLNKSSHKQKQRFLLTWGLINSYTLVTFPLHGSLKKFPSFTRRRFHYLNGCYIVGSCNGLICLYTKSCHDQYGEDYSIYFWNPTTRNISTQLGSFIHNFQGLRLNSFQFAFGFDDSTITYKVVAFHVQVENNASAKSEVKVFTLGGNTWRNIQSFPVIPLNSVNSNGVHVSSALNWLAVHDYFHPFYTDTYITNVEQFVIISLDLSTETYKVLLLPQGFVEVPNVRPALRVLMEALCFSYVSKEHDFVLWQMKEYGVQESWTQLFKISHLDLKINYFDDGYQMVYLYKNDDIVIFSKGFGNLAVAYNLRDQITEQIKVDDWRVRLSQATVYIKSLAAVS